jgi:hypothetical protein
MRPDSLSWHYLQHGDYQQLVHTPLVRYEMTNVPHARMTTCNAWHQGNAIARRMTNQLPMNLSWLSAVSLRQTELTRRPLRLYWNERYVPCCWGCMYTLLPGSGFNDLAFYCSKPYQRTWRGWGLFQSWTWTCRWAWTVRHMPWKAWSLLTARCTAKQTFHSKRRRASGGTIDSPWRQCIS